MAHYEEFVWEGTLTARTRRERTACAYRSHIPDPLVGRELLLPADLVADLADAERAVAALQASDTCLASVESVARLLLRAEAVGSSYIEGLQINARRLANIDAMREALELAEGDRPITVEDICQLHTRLLAGTRDAHGGGVVRQEHNWIGGTNPCRAAYVPSPHSYVPELLDDLCAYVSGDRHSAIVQAALVHAQFETIHPFVDGNGRVGRALIHLVLRRRGLAPSFLPHVSLILAGLEQQWRTQVGRLRANSSVAALLSALPGLPVLTVDTAATALGRSQPRLRSHRSSRRHNRPRTPARITRITKAECFHTVPLGDERSGRRCRTMESFYRGMCRFATCWRRET